MAKFHSKDRDFRCWIGQVRVEFNNHVFETENAQVLAGLRERLRRPMPRGLMGMISEVAAPAPQPAPKKEEVKAEAKAEEKAPEVKAPEAKAPDKKK